MFAKFLKFLFIMFLLYIGLLFVGLIIAYDTETTNAPLMLHKQAQKYKQ